MFQSLRESLQTWNKTNSNHAKLQHTYVVLTVATVVLAGLVGLINYNLGQSILFGAIVLALVFITNAVVWALLESFVLSRFGRRPVNRK